MSSSNADLSIDSSVRTERMQKEENSRDTLPVIVENCAERSDIPDTEEKKNSSEKSRKKVGSSEKKKKKSALSENKEKKAPSSEKTKKQTWNKLTSSICFLDVWNMRFPEAKQGTEEENRRRGLMLGFEIFDIDARKMREKNPHRIPVSVEKDARSDIPEIDMKKYQVGDKMPVGELVYLIRWRIRLSKKKPIFVFFKNTKPPMDALMSAIYEENKDEDGFLHVTYSGEEKNVNENSRSGNFALAESSFKQENPMERMQAEENTPNPIPMIVENAAAGSDTPDVEDKKNSSERKRKQGCSRVFYPIASLDMWNSSAYKMMVKKAATEGPGALGVYGWSMKRLKNIEYRCACGIDAWKMREKRPDYIPVTVEKDAKSDIPEVDMKIHHVHGDAPLEYFVHFMEAHVRRDWTRKPVFVFFKNTKPTMDALMSAIYEENKDEDGFLHVTYSGQERLCGSNEDQQECF